MDMGESAAVGEDGSEDRIRLMPIDFEISIGAPEPHDLRSMMVLGGPEAGFGIPAILAVGVAVLVVQNGDDPVNDVQGQSSQALELLARDRLGSGQLPVAREGDDFAHDLSLGGWEGLVVPRQDPAGAVRTATGGMVGADQRPASSARIAAPRA